MERCSAFVTGQMIFLERPCARKGRYEYEGRFYCKQHYLSNVAARAERRQAASEVQREKEKKECLLNDAAPDLLEALEGMLEIHESVMAQASRGLSAYSAETIQLMNGKPMAARNAVKKAKGE